MVERLTMSCILICRNLVLWGAPWFAWRLCSEASHPPCLLYVVLGGMCETGDFHSGVSPKKNGCKAWNLDKIKYICYPMKTLCTAYKSTVQTEQTIDPGQGVGPHVWQWNVYIHGTVVANTDFVGVFLYFFTEKTPQKCHRAIKHFLWR